MKCNICGESPTAPHPEGVSFWECKCRGLSINVTQRTKYEAEQYRIVAQDLGGPLHSLPQDEYVQ